MFNRTNYPTVETPPDRVKELRAGGLSVTRIARALHISPTKFQQRIARDVQLQRALDEGTDLYEQNKAALPRAKALDPDDAEFETIIPLQPLDSIILAAIAAGTCDRAAIETLLNPRKSKTIQITPSLERLLQHGKIGEQSPTRGVILTKYAVIDRHSETLDSCP